MQYILGTSVSHWRVSELITGDRNPALVFLFPFNDAFTLVKGWDYTSQEHTSEPLPPFHAHTLTLSHCFQPSLFTDLPSLCNYRFSTQSVLTGCVSDTRLAQSQTTDRVQESLQIIFNPSTGPRCRTFTYTERLSNPRWQRANTEHLQQLLLSTSPSNTHRRVSSYTHTHAYAYGGAVRLGWSTIILQTDSIWQRTSDSFSSANCLRPLMSTNAHAVFHCLTLIDVSSFSAAVLAKALFNMIIIDSSWIVCSSFSSLIDDWYEREMCCHISREEHDFSQILSNEKPVQFSLTPLTFNWCCIQDNWKGNSNSALNTRIWILGILALLAIYTEEREGSLLKLNGQSVSWGVEGLNTFMWNKEEGKTVFKLS